MIPLAPVSMIGGTGGGKVAFVLGAVLLLAMIHAKQQQSKPTTTPR